MTQRVYISHLKCCNLYPSQYGLIGYEFYEPGREKKYRTLVWTSNIQSHKNCIGCRVVRSRIGGRFATWTAYADCPTAKSSLWAIYVYEIVGGSERLKTIRVDGFAPIECYFTKCADDQENEFLVACMMNTKTGEWIMINWW